MRNITSRLQWRASDFVQLRRDLESQLQQIAPCKTWTISQSNRALYLSHIEDVSDTLEECNVQSKKLITEEENQVLELVDLWLEPSASIGENNDMADFIELELNYSSSILKAISPRSPPVHYPQLTAIHSTTMTGPVPDG